MSFTFDNKRINIILNLNLIKQSLNIIFYLCFSILLHKYIGYRPSLVAWRYLTPPTKLFPKLDDDPHQHRTSSSHHREASDYTSDI